MNKKLLFEIGVEELPARFIPGAMRHMAERGEQLLSAARLRPQSVEVSATPRRLVLSATVSAMQPDQQKEVKGPPVKAAYDAQGAFTRAALGFARGQGVSAESLYRAPYEGGEYVFAKVEERGRSALEVLAEVLPELLLSFSFPKAMRWASYDIKWARPIRWIVALLGDQVINFEVAGIQADRQTYGLRFLHPDPISVPDASQHERLLSEAHVILNHEERYRTIKQLVQEAAAQRGGHVDENDEALFREVTDINEYPSVVVGGFDPEYLKLPVEVIITPMRLHQKYFPVYQTDGSLLPLFITIRNGLADEQGNVRVGNEKVLAARLADAAFFYEEDRKIKLVDRLPRLETLVFQEKLGTMRCKAERLQRLAPAICRVLGGSAQECATAERAALLSKSDLVTNMVFEFTELQGVMGGHYAISDGEDPAVAKAISEQYRPNSSGGALPETVAGRALALADKIDSLTGYFGIGSIPSGSQDPFALRRAALGVIAIIKEAGVRVALTPLIKQAYDLYGGDVQFKNDRSTTCSLLDEFFRGRMRSALTEDGYRYDLVDAVLAGGELDPFDFHTRIAALDRVSGTEDFLTALAVFNRAGNLASKATTDSFDRGALPEEADQQLVAAYENARQKVTEALHRGGNGNGNGNSNGDGDASTSNVTTAIQALAGLREAVDYFFDTVLVMVPDEKIRRSRLALLRSIVALFDNLWDWSKIVI
ncbi:MAG TPA: glycine--tRNA ligase subunit beta [Firmicutes bacterium]|nr:glycine--tRNA ligase subunit beta [Bacillota bacterium]HCT36511.1 glycine--tRNA ligase subunit beta [Bacillota bacterium]